MIEARLAEATFLIAILTPNFLSRPWCCKEIRLFREREKQLGRSNLIFPVEYMDIGDMRGRMRDRIADPDVLTLLDSRQIKDFKKHRRVDPASAVVGDFVEDLCGEIKNRLLGMRPPPPEPIVNTGAVAVASPARRLLPGTVMREDPGPEMVLIPAGSFLMGVPASESKREDSVGYDNKARPQHTVTIAHPFWLGRYPVTRGEYAVFAAETGRDGETWASPGFAQDDRHPVVNVSHIDAQAYTRWLSDKTGQTYRLPSEAEWEYAARAGTTTARYWGDAAGKPGEHARFGFPPGRNGGTSPVGSFKPNAFGAYDMLGNVWEWTEDAWHDSYEGAPADGSAWTAGGAANRVLRGGSWNGGARGVRSAYRNHFDPAHGNDFIGFRCARVQSESDGGPR